MRILLYCDELRDLGVLGRGFTRYDLTQQDHTDNAEDGWASENAMAHFNMNAALAMEREQPQALTVLRTGYGPLDDSNQPAHIVDGTGHRVRETWTPVRSVKHRQPNTLAYALNNLMRYGKRGQAGQWLDLFMSGLRHFAIYHEALGDGRRGFIASSSKLTLGL